MLIKKQKIILGAFLLLFIGLILFSCKDKGTDVMQDKNNSFQFKISVKDAAGNPVNGLRVSAWDVLSIDNLLKKASGTNQLNKTEMTYAVSTLNFSIAANAYVSLTVHNLRNNEVDTLFERVGQAGQHAINWAPSFSYPSGVYKILLKASNDTIHFQDSIYAVCHTPDPEETVIGWITQNGVFEVADNSLFPNNLDLPTFLQTNSGGPDVIGTFNYTDSVAVVLTDTSTNKQQWYYVTIGKQKNTFNLIWDPPHNPLVSSKQDFHPITKIQSIADDTAIVEIPPLKWKLEQNYPNPFN
jgi:hypothetical protein